MSVDKITVLLYSSPLSQAVPLGLIIMFRRFTQYLDSSPQDDRDDKGDILTPSHSRGVISLNSSRDRA
jgi:hypothetical protein